MSSDKIEIQPASGKLGILTVGLGAVSTTLIGGVEAIRRGIAKPIGSVTQMSTIRLGKRTDKNVPMVKDFVPLTALDDVAFVRQTAQFHGDHPADRANQAGQGRRYREGASSNRNQSRKGAVHELGARIEREAVAVPDDGIDSADQDGQRL